MSRAKIQAFGVVNGLFLLLLCFLMFYPFWNQLVISFSSPRAYYSDWYHLWPTELSLHAYRYNFQEPQVFRSFLVSIAVTVAGTALSMVLTTMAGYFLSKNHLPGRNAVFLLFVITMFLDGGLIPTYVLVTSLRLKNTLAALILPSALNVYFLVLVKNYFQSLPPSLEESARLDGANDLRVLASITIPMSSPIIATVSLFYAVGYWNDWFLGMIYLTNQKLYPLSLYLRGLIAMAASSIEQARAEVELEIPGTVRAAVVIITITPIICVYPLLQKHFVKGIMLGAVKQ